MKNVDIVTVGDIAVDAFIRLKEASVHCNINRSRCELSLRFADKVPYESVTEISAVGNSANASVAIARLGLRSALISNLGEDTNGRKCLDVLKEEGVETGYVKFHKNSKTNYHYVLWYEDERTILVKHEPYEYLFPKKLPETKWFYLSSLGNDTLPYHEDIKKILESRPEIKLCFQPGTFQMKSGVSAMRFFYERAEVFACNREEAGKILDTDTQDISALLSKMSALGPKITLITDGPKGAYMRFENLNYFMPIYPDPKPPLERTGAGDSFTATFVSALIMSKTPLEALRRAPINPMSVVQNIGAQKGLLSLKKIEDFLQKAPENYRPQKI